MPSTLNGNQNDTAHGLSDNSEFGLSATKGGAPAQKPNGFDLNSNLLRGQGDVAQTKTEWNGQWTGSDWNIPDSNNNQRHSVTDINSDTNEVSKYAVSAISAIDFDRSSGSKSDNQPSDDADTWGGRWKVSCK